MHIIWISFLLGIKNDEKKRVPFTMRLIEISRCKQIYFEHLIFTLYFSQYFVIKKKEMCILAKEKCTAYVPLPECTRKTCKYFCKINLNIDIYIYMYINLSILRTVSWNPLKIRRTGCSVDYFAIPLFIARYIIPCALYIIYI